MTSPDAALEAYSRYRHDHLELFINQPDTVVEIIFRPRGTPSTRHRSCIWVRLVVLFRDAVRFRDGSIGPYLCMLPAADDGGEQYYDH